ncbi:MAG: peptidylprolyl isomerase [Planctomycetes bacterium]|nr:peptidylprolyl isomerase [Planctomycetota bacterium]
MSSGDQFARRPSSRRRASNRARLGFEQLEAREVPATLATIADQTTPDTKDLYVPLTVTNTTGTVSYTATSANSQVQVQVVTGGTTIVLHVTGTKAAGGTFEGDLTFRLFDSMAPITTARIVSLVNSGFYNNLTFHRIIDGFVAQGGDPLGTGSGGSGTKIDDEFNTHLTFNSPGLLAMANSGDDTGDSQFFITDTDLTLAQEPQHLNFQHTIFGQLVAGFDTFTQLMSTPVTSSATGSPVNPVTITSASVVANDPNGVLRITAPSTFTGTSAITVTPADGGASSTGDTFNVTFTADTVNDPPFLGPIADQTTTVGTGVTFKLTATDLENDTLTYSVVSATTTGGETVNVTSKIDQKTGLVTVTPPDNFVGTIKLKLGVKDATSTVDTQVINLTVTGSFDLNTVSDTGTLNNDNITSLDTPSLTVLAPTGRTVTVSINGVAAGTAIENASTGQYRLSLPANRLLVGPNTITGTVTNGTSGTTALTPFTLTYLPTLKNFYVVPGTIGSTQQLTFQFTSHESMSTSEFGFYKADDATGKIGTLKPGDAGYAAAALARRQVVFAKGETVGASVTLTAKGGDVLVMYIVQGNTSVNLLAQNPTNAFTPGKPIAFFGITAANPDGVAHVSTASDPGDSQALMGFEDGNSGGDKDYNDMVVNIRKQGDTQSAALVVPGGNGRAVTVTGTVKLPVKAQPLGTGVGAPQSGEIGVIVTDDASGKIGTLNPGDAGYAAAALARAQILFAPGAVTGASTTTTLTGGQSVIFYYVPGGTAAQVIAANPTNSATGSKIAFFSLTAANPDGKQHARNFDPERVAQVAPTPTDPTAIHMMGKVNGGVADFDDVSFTIGFGA